MQLTFVLFMVCGIFLSSLTLTQCNSNHPEAAYPDRLGPSGNFIENSTSKLALKLPVIGWSTVLYSVIAV
jgi:hypothetical protein